MRPDDVGYRGQIGHAEPACRGLSLTHLRHSAAPVLALGAARQADLFKTLATPRAAQSMLGIEAEQISICR
jgi:hypothetical protein